MAARSKPLVPLTEDDRTTLVNEVSASAEPLTAAQAAKLPFAGRKTTAAEVLPLLEDSVRRGELHEWPPKTKQGPIRFWGRTLRSLAETAIVEAVTLSKSPLTAKEVARSLKAPVKLTEEQIVPILQELVSRRVVHTFPAATPRGKERYWAKDEREFAERCVLNVLDTKGPQTQAALKKTVKWLDSKAFGQLMDDLTASLRIRRHPPLGRAKQDLFGLQPPHPEPYLKDVESQLTKTIKLLLAADVSEKQLRRAVLEMVEAAGIEPPDARVDSREVLIRVDPPTVDLVALMERLEPGAARGALVGARDLRRAASMDKQAFDTTVLALSRQGRLSLHRHDFAASLSPQDRDELVADGQGNYYVGVALRQSSG